MDGAASRRSTGEPAGPSPAAADALHRPDLTPSPAPRVALVEGPGPKLIDQTIALLRSRLRTTSVVLFFLNVTFLLQGVISGIWPGNSHPWLLWYHMGTVVVMAIIAVHLFLQAPTAMLHLRAIEALLFALPSTLFFGMFYLDILAYAAQGDEGRVLAAAKTSCLGWFGLIFVYAMFIPNDWRRGTFAVYGLAGAPIFVVLLARWESVIVAEAIPWNQVSEMTALMFAGASAALYGSHRMHQLRREAFEAKRLGQYRLRELIGAGGMGEVYLAEHTLLKRPCAIKLIQPGRDADPRTLARFEREVRATASLSHWNTVEIFDYGHTEDGTFYYVMEYLPGMNLRQLVERYGPLPPERVIYLLRQVCDALSEAHATGLIHRDIKPANIFLAERGGIWDVVKLLDFGLVRQVSPVGAVWSHDGTITGSPLYISPEQAMGDREPDRRSDIYSLGCVAYYLLTGRPPFDGDRPVKVLIAHAHDPVTPPSELRPDVPEDLERVVMGCLAKSPQQRFQSARLLEQALAGCRAANDWTRERAAEWWRTNDVSVDTTTGTVRV